MKLLMTTMILLAVSMLTVWAADAPHVQIHVLESPNEPPKDAEKAPAAGAKDADVRGSIMIIGPTGVIHSQNFGTGGGAAPDVQQLVERSLEVAGVTLPENVQITLKQAVQQQGQASGSLPASEAADTASKLDRILEQLQKIEQEITELKAARQK